MTETQSQRRPDIAVLTPSLEGGGADFLAFFLCEAFAAAGYEVDLVVMRSAGRLMDREIPGVRKVELKAFTEFLAPVPSYLRYLDRARPRVVFALVHTAKLAAGIGRRLRPQIPVIISVHTTLDRSGLDQWWFRRWFGYGPEGYLYRRCEKVQTISKGLAEECERLFRLQKGSVAAISNPVFDRKFDEKRVAAEHEAIFEKPVIIGAGRLVWQKHFGLLIEAFADVRRTHDANLLILGEGKERRKLTALAEALGVAGSVFLPGWVPDPTPYMERARLFVLSSRFEGFGIVCVEAMAAGTALVFTDCLYGPREISKDGAFARLVPPQDPPAMAAAIAAELESPDRSPAERRAARADWLHQYSPQVIGGLYVDLIRDEIGGPARGG